MLFCSAIPGVLVQHLLLKMMIASGFFRILGFYRLHTGRRMIVALCLVPGLPGQAGPIGVPNFFTDCHGGISSGRVIARKSQLVLFPHFIGWMRRPESQIAGEAQSFSIFGC